MKDALGREINYMRISVTDRCNLRCRYCMPEGIQKVPMSSLLTYEEIAAIAAAAVKLGITRFKITGGEPLVRLGVPELVSMLKHIPHVEQVTMTTNGILLSGLLSQLVNAGLDAVNISLDTLCEKTFEKITGRTGLDQVLQSIDAALDAGLKVKLNTVLLPGINAGEWASIAALARDRKLDVRFIEMMPMGAGRNYAPVSNVELLKQAQILWPGLDADGCVHGNGPARYYHVLGWAGCIGFIGAIHQKFCSRCNRIRLTSQGCLKPCLCYADSTDLMPILRSGSKDMAKHLEDAISAAVWNKPARHCFEDPAQTEDEPGMYRIGG